MNTFTRKASPNAAAELWEAVQNGEGTMDIDDEMGTTDCPEGCVVEPDGWCCHGYESAGLTSGLI